MVIMVRWWDGGSGYICGVSDGGGSNGVRSGDGIARICWGDNPDCFWFPPLPPWGEGVQWLGAIYIK